MRLICLISDINRASTRLRILNSIPYLEGRGIKTEVEIFPPDSDVIGFIRLIRKINGADAILIQKKIHFSGWQRKLLRRASKRIIFDYDDSVMFVELTQGKKLNGKNLVEFCKTLDIVDVAIGGNGFLAEYAEECGVESYVLPTPVDFSKYDGTAVVFADPNGCSTVRIGWIGSRFNLKELEWISEEIVAVSKNRNIELIVVCDKGIEIEGVNVRFVPWSLEDEYRYIAAIDIGIMPLMDNGLWRQGKCAYKAIQFMALGKPVVASAVGFNREVIEHGVNGVLVKEKAGFVSALEELIDDKERRNRYGQLAMERIDRDFGIKCYSNALVSIVTGSACGNGI